MLVALAALALGLCTALPDARSVAFAGAGVVSLYALSLGILELAELASGASVSQDFQRGHTADDLTYSSPLGRPLSFLAVGILLLASGFFYQRLSERMAGRDPEPS